MKKKYQIKLKTQNSLCLIIISTIILLPNCLETALAEEAKKLSIPEVNKALSESKYSLSKGKQTATELDDQLRLISRDVSIFQKKLVNISKKIQSTEVSLDSLKKELKILGQQREKKQLELIHATRELGEVISALQRISYIPKDLVIVTQASVRNVSRTRLLLSSITQSLQIRTLKLRKTVAQLENIKNEESQREMIINTRIKHLNMQRTDLKMQLSKKIALKRNTTMKQENTANSLEQLATKTKVLQNLLAQLIDKIEKSDRQQTYTDIPLLSESRTNKSNISSITSTNYKMVSLKNLRMPIQGKVVSHFNEDTEFGFLTKGIIIRTNFGEEVRAPSEGRVVFSGPFHEYGMLLIIDHGAGYHTVLAGLNHIYNISDQHVLIGEPIGVMNSPNEKQPELYMELRRRGHPINPIPWLETNNNKVSGG